MFDTMSSYSKKYVLGYTTIEIMKRTGSVIQAQPKLNDMILILR